MITNSVTALFLLHYLLDKTGGFQTTLEKKTLIENLSADCSQTRKDRCLFQQNGIRVQINQSQKTNDKTTKTIMLGKTVVYLQYSAFISKKKLSYILTRHSSHIKKRAILALKVQKMHQSLPCFVLTTPELIMSFQLLTLVTAFTFTGQKE